MHKSTFNDDVPKHTLIGSSLNRNDILSATEPFRVIISGSCYMGLIQEIRPNLLLWITARQVVVSSISFQSLCSSSSMRSPCDLFFCGARSPPQSPQITRRRGNGGWHDEHHCRNMLWCVYSGCHQHVFGAMMSCKKQERAPKIESNPTEAPKPADSN